MNTPGKGSQETLYANLFPRTISKSEKRKIQILEAAITCYASLGIDNTTYEHIASKCKASRTLLIHYFPDRDTLSKLAIRYIRADMQNDAVKAIQKAATPEKQLSAYVQSTFDWVKHKPSYFTVWMLFFYYCGVHKDYKAMHTELAAMGHERIQVMIQAMHGNRSVKNLEQRAKSLQALITGALTCVHVENFPLDRKAFSEQVIKDCLRIAKGE